MDKVSIIMVNIAISQREPDTEHQGCRGQIALASNCHQRRIRWHGTVEEELLFQDMSQTVS